MFGFLTTEKEDDGCMKVWDYAFRSWTLSILEEFVVASASKQWSSIKSFTCSKNLNDREVRLLDCEAGAAHLAR